VEVSIFDFKGVEEFEVRSLKRIDGGETKGLIDCILDLGLEIIWVKLKPICTITRSLITPSLIILG